MPNWVKNKIELSGRASDIERLLACVKNEDGCAFDFRKIIPIPATLLIESSSDSMIGLDFVSSNESSFTRFISKRFPRKNVSSIIARKDRIIRLGKIASYNKKKYGYLSGYYWKRVNWGCKWNCDEPRVYDGVIMFDTPWNAPFPIIEKLHSMFPQLDMTFSWADEDYGYNCGQVTLSNGVAVNLDIVEGSEEAENFATDLWEEWI